MRSCPATRLVALPLLAWTAATACVQKQTRALTSPDSVRALDGRSAFLKAHMRDGSVYVLRDWRVVEPMRQVRGSGELYGPGRDLTRTGDFQVSLDSVALFETNVVETSPSVAALALITGASVALTVFCIANPKTCFGSCPTFYVSDGRRLRLQAEGFSASVSPALEATDLDALYRARPVGRRLEILMKNEALETHVVRRADVLVVQRAAGARIIATQAGELWAVRDLQAPVRCQAADGGCTAEVAVFDDRTRYSAADSSDLAARETIELEFDLSTGTRPGLVVAARQTLLSTYLFYQTLAYMGRSAGTWLTALERGDVASRERAAGIGRLLGGIEVQVRDRDRQGAWQTVGVVHETGPLATDTRVVPLPETEPGPLEVRLRLTRGLWRLDWVALADLQQSRTPIRIRPIEVYRSGRPDPAARRRLLDPEDALVTLPGDEYLLVYPLPDEASEYEIFLESRGYYLEWMRQEWLAEEDPAKAALIFLRPAVALRVLAPEFKRVEPDLEDLFWSSRYVRP